MIEVIKDKKTIENIFKNIFNTELKTTVYSNIIIYKEEKIMGFMIYDLIYDRIELEYIGVIEEYRNKKIASKLMDYLINLKLPISLEVNINNIKAINLYKKYNFKQASIRKNYYNDEDAYLMIREV